MPSRNYGQACSVARFLDQLGNRWTLLLVRDLLVGPRRFKDLLANSPAMGPNLLSERLRELQSLGIVTKTKSTGETPMTYALTVKGQALEPIVLAMARWGLNYLEVNPKDPGTSRPDLLVVAFRAAFMPDLAAGATESYEFRVDDVTFFAEIVDGVLTTGLGPTEDPAFVLTTDSDTFDRIGSGRIGILDAKKKGLLDVFGSQQAFMRFRRYFGG